MKLFTTLSLICISIIGYSQVQKIPFFEHFTNASCPPCATQNPGMDALLEAQTAEYTRISYQGDFPGADIMNAEYPSGPLTRRQNYGVTAFPTLVANSQNIGGPSALNQGLIDSYLALTSPLSIAVTQTWDASGSITVNIDIENVTSTDYNNSIAKLHVAMVENHIHIENPNAGTNGETEFHSVLRQFYDASTGNPSSSPIALGLVPANSTVNFNFTIPAVPAYIRDLNELKFVVFAQEGTSGNIVQSGQSIQGGAPGLNTAASSASIFSSDYCNYDFTPVISITNNDVIDITSANVEYSVNGGAVTMQQFSGTISPGMSEDVTFPTIVLNESSTIDYTVNTVNGSSGYVIPAAMEIASEEVIKLSTSSVGTSINEDFEGYSTFTPSPVGVISENPNDISAFIINGNTASLTNLGGHGQSNTCFMWNYWSIPSGSSKLIWDKIDLSSLTNSKLSFDRAYAQYATNTNDRLIVKASIDCGNTWTSVFDKQGAQLATAPINNSSRFYPTANEWVTDTIDLSEFNGMDEVVIAFEGISFHGNNLYIDNLDLFGVIAVPSVENTVSSTAQSIYCEDSVEINLNFTNNGNVPLNTGIISSTLNGGTPDLIQFTLSTPLAIGNSTTINYWVPNPENGSYNLIETEFLELNGMDYSSNTQISGVNFLSVINFVSNSNIGRFEILFDANADQTSWSLTDETFGFEVMSSAGQSFSPNTLFTDYFTLFENHCYRFEIFDQNGLCCSQGNGSYDLNIDGVSISSGSFFQGLRESKFKFTLNQGASTENLTDEIGFTIYPNPTNGLVYIKTNKAIENASIRVFNNLGQEVFVENNVYMSNSDNRAIRLNELSTGSYWMKIVSDNATWSEKLTITK